MADDRFWAASTSEPKRAYRFVLHLDGLDSWVITKVNRPGFAVTEASHQYLNHTFYYPGRVEYNTVSFTMVDPLQPNSTAYAFAMLGQSGYELPTANKFNTISKAKALAALGEPSIHTYNADGKIVETFTLKNAWVKNVEMGDFDYSTDDLINITVEMRYDFVQYNMNIGEPKTNTSTKAAKKFAPGQ